MHGVAEPAQHPGQRALGQHALHHPGQGTARVHLGRVAHQRPAAVRRGHQLPGAAAGRDVVGLVLVQGEAHASVRRIELPDGAVADVGEQDPQVLLEPDAPALPAAHARLADVREELGMGRKVEQHRPDLLRAALDEAAGHHPARGTRAFGLGLHVDCHHLARLERLPPGVFVLPSHGLQVDTAGDTGREGGFGRQDVGRVSGGSRAEGPVDRQEDQGQTCGARHGRSAYPWRPSSRHTTASWHRGSRRGLPDRASRE